MVQLKKTREEIVNKAGELAVEYERMYSGCAQCTFMAVADSLRWGGFEIIPPEMEDKLYPGLCLLSAGVGITGEGTCGAVTGGTLAVGLALSTLRGVDYHDMSIVGEGCDMVRKDVMATVVGRYGSHRCMEIQLKRFGKAFDFRRSDMSDEFLAITDGCAIREVSQAVTAAIVDEVVKA